MEVVILVKLWIPTFQTKNFGLENNELSMGLELDLLDEKRELAAVRTTYYKDQTAKFTTAMSSIANLRLGILFWDKHFKTLKILFSGKLALT